MLFEEPFGKGLHPLAMEKILLSNQFSRESQFAK
jgi:hypothetical protein